MVLEKLGNSLKETLKKIAKSIFVDDKLVDELVKDIQRALLSSDVNVKLVFDLSKKIKERFLKEKQLPGINPREHLIKIVYEELVNILGEEKSEINIIKKKPFKIMMVGVYGSGKTTTIGKLAKYYFKRGYKIACIGLDVHRPAAPDQLEQICDKINIPVFIDKKEKNPLKIYKEFENLYSKYDILIVDTAGRDSLTEDLIQELKKLNEEIKPDETLLVMSADIGQAAEKLALGFKNACNVTGVVITKLDGTGKGGGALTGSSVTNAKVKFIGVGEKVDDLELFNPEGFVSRLLGMGDLEALLEKAKEAITEEEAQDIQEKLQKGELSLIDLYEQMQAMRKMGPLSKVLEMVPGFGQMKMPKEMLEVQEEKLVKWKFIINSMNKKELENPEIIDAQRIERIAKGAGVSTNDVRDLLKQYKQSKKVLKLLKGGDPSKLMKKFQGKLPKG
ncbi:MAG: signal recognition particle protein Srp54, partial [Nanoarchaeota archaeon]